MSLAFKVCAREQKVIVTLALNAARWEISGFQAARVDDCFRRKGISKTNLWLRKATKKFWVMR
jgi:hypothetical protein